MAKPLTDFSDFDIREPTTRKNTEEGMIAIQVALSRFIAETLPALDPQQLHRLVCALPAQTVQQIAGPANPGAAYGANFSIADEITQQLAAVNALRTHYFPNGQIRDNVNMKEFKDMLSTCNQMIKTLMDNHSSIMNMERMRQVEEATVEVLLNVSQELRDKFLELLTHRLEAIE